MITYLAPSWCSDCKLEAAQADPIQLELFQFLQSTYDFDFAKESDMDTALELTTLIILTSFLESLGMCVIRLLDFERKSLKLPCDLGRRMHFISTTELIQKIIINWGF